MKRERPQADDLTLQPRVARTRRFPALAALPLAAVLVGGAVASTQGMVKRTPLPRYVSIETADTLRRLRGEALPTLAPLANGKPLPASLPSLPGARTQSVDAAVKKIARATKNPSVAQKASAKPVRLAQAFPQPIPPARVRRAAVTTPRWVRYPLEFQLCGIGIGTRAVDKDRFNRIDRYGLFAMHGNPTAIVVPEAQPAAGAGGMGGAMGAGMMGAGAMGAGMAMPGAMPPTMGGAMMPGAMPGMGMPGTTTTTTTTSVTMQQTPPVAGTGLFPGGTGDAAPDWASAITVPLDDNHVQWLYRRENYSMGFVVDRLGYVDAIVVAGTESPIARTQLEDPVHTVKLGDDLRKVLFRYGYPDSIETFAQNLGASASSTGGIGGATSNGAYRTFELRYEQSYNVVFTIRNNRVARIYIFGDPDFFNEIRRRQFRVSY